MKVKLLRLYRRYREKAAFGAYVTTVLFLAPLVAHLVGTGWEQSQLVRSLLSLSQLAGVSSGIIILVGLGLSAGLLILMVLDRKNRPQGIVLLIGFGIVTVQLIRAGQFIPVETAINPVVWVVPGALAGFVFGGGTTLLRLRSLAPQEFRRAPRLLSIVVMGVLLAAMIEAHVQYPEILAVSQNQVELVRPDTSAVGLGTDGLAVNALITVGAISTVRRFTGYDADTEFFVLGPPRSGKSLLLIGAYLEALGNSGDSVRRSEELNPSQDLMELIENLDKDTSKWIVEATGQNELRNLEFKYVRGSLFRENVTISALDYAGEHLTRLPDALDGDQDEGGEQLAKIATEVQAANTLILLIDAERYINNDGLHLAEYFAILDSVKNQDVILVATKSDIFADMFWEEYEQAPQDAFEEFRKYVESQLTNSEQFESLLRQTPTSEVHPVYYETEFNENGERIPYRDDTGSVVTVGFKQLLSKLGR